MKIFKGKYGWSTKAWAKKDEPNKCYISVGFPQGFEPVGEEFECELFVKDKNGNCYECYFGKFNDKQGNEHPKLMIKKSAQESKVSELFGGNVKTTNIDMDDLPFDI